MRKVVLLITCVIASQVINAQFYINEIMVDPPGTDNPNEYIEIRGAANTPLTNTYLLTIEGDGNDPGDVNEVIDLTGQTTGSNGYLVLLTTGHPYSVDSSANIALDLTDGELEGQSHTFLLVQATTPPTTGDDIDSDNDGTPDGTPYTDWTILDSFALLRDNDSSGQAYAYSLVGFLEDDTAQADPAVFAPAGANIVVTTSSQFDYVARIGNSTGSALTNDENTSDWYGGDLPSGNLPNWTISTSSTGIKAYPGVFAGVALDHIGADNPTAALLSITEQELTSDISFFPNPTTNVINISSKNDIVSSIEVVDVTGKILVQKKNDLDVIDLTPFSTGLYYMNIYGDGAKITKAIVKN
ncbi:T9SS type A sorting domain-containing protein [Aquimarina sp. 2201CG14-23]|uniref:T9SS type A sorting domain-containing protein n=1 Tax=Aquimarina mycalae TaxID=3040073 RepID=UPI002477FF5E|nr:T9SS type A sorting domain-containing protein [Aquimarina sp. 2201CG14-23]MDH7448068.1 T9SS type A sorting domain-containing protein [Aquimarina sp. 2201CG14-23]